MKPLPEGKTGQHAGRNLSFAGSEPHADEDIEEGGGTGTVTATTMTHIPWLR